MLELFHRIADPGSAQVRRYITQHGLEATVQFRNVAYPEAEAALEKHGGARTPALWDGHALFEGPDAVIGRLARGPASTG